MSTFAVPVDIAGSRQAGWGTFGGLSMADTTTRTHTWQTYAAGTLKVVAKLIREEKERKRVVLLAEILVVVLT